MPLFKSWKIGEGMFAIWKVEESNGQRYLESGRIERAIEGFIERGIPL